MKTNKEAFETHNGHANYPTFLLAAEIANKESLYNKFHGYIRKQQELKKPPDRDWMRGKLMTDLQLYAEKCAPKKNGSIWDSIFNDILKEVINYREIAEELLEDENYKY